jgi:pyridoxamine 5'-phosphate oxidase
MTQWKTIADIRREYGKLSLSEDKVPECPMTQFERWFADVVKTEKSDPTAMVLSTVDEQGHPDSRVVLLKETKDGSFIFYTNYQSAKSIHIKTNPYAALNFYWPEMARQVRVRGRVKKVSKEQSSAYFSSRPRTSQLSAMASPQSSEIINRQELEQRLNDLITKYQQEPLICPDFWGGYEVIPDEIEFWQGRDNRLHDRIHYYRDQGKWLHRRLAP